MIDRRKFLLGSGALLGGALGAAPAAATAPIVMGYFDNYPPFSFRDAHGEMSGVLIDGVNLVGHAAGLTFTHQGYPWVRTQALVQSGHLDGFCTTVSRARLAYAEFCATPIVIERFGFAHRIEDQRMVEVHSVADLRAFNQGSYTGAGYAVQHLEPDHIHWYRDEDTVLRMIDSGSLDIYVGGEIVTSLRLKTLGLTQRMQFTLAHFLPTAQFCFGLRRSYPEIATVLAKMESATRAVRKTGALDALLDPYR